MKIEQNQTRSFCIFLSFHHICTCYRYLIVLKMLFMRKISLFISMFDFVLFQTYIKLSFRKLVKFNLTTCNHIDTLRFVFGVHGVVAVNVLTSFLCVIKLICTDIWKISVYQSSHPSHDIWDFLKNLSDWAWIKVKWEKQDFHLQASAKVKKWNRLRCNQQEW